MRKFPIYNLLQELTMQMMMVIVVIAYISYDQIEIIGGVGYVILGICGVGIVFLFRNQLTNMRPAKLITKFNVHRSKVLNRNWTLNIVFNSLITIAAAFHFYLWMDQGKDLEPLYYEYGFGIVLGVLMIWYNANNFEVIVTDQGVAVGSKMELKLILWNDILKAEKSSEYLTINLKSNWGITQIKLPKNKELEALTTLLKMNGKIK